MLNAAINEYVCSLGTLELRMACDHALFVQYLSSTLTWSYDPVQWDFPSLCRSQLQVVLWTILMQSGEDWTDIRKAIDIALGR